MGLFLLLLPAQLHAKLEFSETRIRYEAKPDDERMEAIFRFKNIGETPVLITKLSSDCGCTIPKLTKNRYMPGESGEVTAIFKFGDRKGPQERTVTVTTSEGKSPYILTMEANIPELLSVMPRSLFFHPQDSQPAKSALIESKVPESPITDILITPSDPNCVVFLNKIIEGQWLLTIIKPDLTAEKQRIAVNIKATFASGLVREHKLWVMTSSPSTSVTSSKNTSEK